MKNIKIAVFVSGNGSNLEALIRAEREGELENGRIVLVVSDNPQAYALERANKYGIGTFVLESRHEKTREEYDAKVLEALKDKDIDLVLLAGFMRILSPVLIDAFKGRMMNIHPSLLPAFKGAHAIKDAFESSDTVTGVTVHFVTLELDSGPVILQTAVDIDAADTLGSLEKKIHDIEHKIYPQAVRLYLKNKLKIEGTRVIIK